MRYILQNIDNEIYYIYEINNRKLYDIGRIIGGKFTQTKPKAFCCDWNGENSYADCHLTYYTTFEEIIAKHLEQFI